MNDMILIQAGDFDPVGKPAFHLVDGMIGRAPIGAVEKVYRFGEVDGMKANPDGPLYRVAGAIYPAGELVIGLVGRLHDAVGQAGESSPLGDEATASPNDSGHAAGDAMNSSNAA